MNRDEMMSRVRSVEDMYGAIGTLLDGGEPLTKSQRMSILNATNTLRKMLAHDLRGPTGGLADGGGFLIETR